MSLKSGLKFSHCLFVLITTFLLSVFSAAQITHIDSVSPAHAVPGTQVTLTGTNFGATQGSGFVLLGNNASIVSWSNTQIVATVPAGAGAGFAYVSQYGAYSNGLPLRIDPPTLTSVSPASGPRGTQVTLTGTGFGATQGTGYVLLGSVNATVVSWSNTQIVATVAATSGSGSVLVSQYGGSSNGFTFRVDPPTLTSVSPASGTAGTQVTLSGIGFGASQGSGTVLLGTLNASVVSWNNTQIVATVASGSGAGYASVTQYGGTSNGVLFNVTGTPPVLTSVTPNIGTPGVTQITLTGSGFGSVQGTGRIQLGTVYLTNVTSWSDTQIVATMPSPTAPGVARVQQT